MGVTVVERFRMSNGADSPPVERRLRKGAVSAALLLLCVGCGADDAGRRDGGLDVSTRAAQVTSQMHVVPIARKAIERTLPKANIADVVCTSEVMYVSKGAVANCTATVDDVPSGWRLTFVDASGAHTVARRPGAPWQFANP